MPKKYEYRERFRYDGKRYVVYGNSEREVIEKKANKIRDLEEGKVTICSTMPVAKWTEEVLRVYKFGINEKSLEATRYRLNKHLLSRIGNMPLKSVKPTHLQEILNDSLGMSYSHVTKLKQEISFIFEKAVDNGLLNTNPAAKLVKPKSVKGSRRSLTDYEMKHFIAVCDADPGFRVFELMFYCGCRPQEAINAIGKDIDLSDGSPQLHIRGTKTENADRYVPIPADFYEKVKDTPPFTPIAPNRNNRMHSESSYDRAYYRLKREMNISMGCTIYRNQLQPPLPLAEDFVPYCLRHTFCTNLAKANVDIRTAQRLMGHANIQMTANIYTHVDNSQIQVAADKINAFFAAQEFFRSKENRDAFLKGSPG